MANTKENKVHFDEEDVQFSNVVSQQNKEIKLQAKIGENKLGGGLMTSSFNKNIT